MGVIFVGIMNLTLVLIAATSLQAFFSSTLGIDYRLREMVIFGVIEGMVVGFFIDYILTKKFGTGKQLLEK